MPDQTLVQRPCFHVTHWKAGSQWIADLFELMAPDRVVRPQVGERQLFLDRIRPEGLYVASYVTREQLQLVTADPDPQAVVVLRDLRDTLVSAYFSVRYSHALMTDAIAAMRGQLAACSEEAGMLALLENWLPACAMIQSSWLESGAEIHRYESVFNDVEPFLQSAARHAGVECSAVQVQQLVARQATRDHRHKSDSADSRMNHHRHGVPGDWTQHFTARIEKRFTELYGPLLKRYEAGQGKPRKWKFLGGLLPNASRRPSEPLPPPTANEMLQAFDALIAISSPRP